MSQGHLSSVKKCPRKLPEHLTFLKMLLPLRFDTNQSITTEILHTISFCWCQVVIGGGGVHSYFHVKLNSCFVWLSLGFENCKESSLCNIFNKCLVIGGAWSLVLIQQTNLLNLVRQLRILNPLKMGGERGAGMVDTDATPLEKKKIAFR